LRLILLVGNLQLRIQIQLKLYLLGFDGDTSVVYPRVTMVPLFRDGEAFLCLTNSSACRYSVSALTT
jgi:hypothetical protein